jgi:hypothetical protein
MSSVSDAFGKLLKNSTVSQIFLWNIFGSLLSALLQPTLTDITEHMQTLNPFVPLTPEEAATAVNRGFSTKDSGVNEARKSGVNSDRFQKLVDLAGVAPGADELAEALRRGIIPEDSGDAEGTGFIQGIRQGNLANKWAKVVKKLAVKWPSPGDALNAYLEGQIDEAEAKELYHKFGGDLQFFDMLYNTEGSAPTPSEAAEMANRGIIPWDGRGAGATSFEQAFLEGPWRNKWLGPFKKAAQYYPPPRTITAMVREGSLTDEQGLNYLKKQGLNDELAHAYLKGAHESSNKDTKDLARTTIMQMYSDGLIDDSQVISTLTGMGYSQSDAKYLLSIQQLKRTEQAINSAIAKIHSLYIGYKINSTDAVNALNKLRIPDSQVSNLVNLWTVEREQNTRDLTQAQIVDAWFDNIISQNEAETKLNQIGYTVHDAWIILCIKAKKRLPNEP